MQAWQSSHKNRKKNCEFSSSHCAVLSLHSTGLLFGRVAKDFPFFEQEKSIKIEGMERKELNDTMFTSITTENQYTKSSLEVIMMERTAATFASWVCCGW